MRKLIFWSLLSLFCAGYVNAQSVSGCGDLANAFGPFDYTNPTQAIENLNLVERAHFTTEVEALIKGATGTLWGDLDYTLRAFPNHHRALYAVARYALMPDSPTTPGFYPRDCYFRRAIAFRPNDGMVHMIYGIYLHKQNNSSEAAEEYQKAAKLMPDSAEVHYNLGLLYADQQQFDSALQHAQRAYELGYPLDGLKNKLISAGAWSQAE